MKRIIKEQPGIELESIDITTSPLRAWRDGIRMIPTIRHGNMSLSGFTLSRSEIDSFLNKINNIS